MAIPRFEIEFDKKGEPVDRQQLEQAIAALRAQGPTDLFVVSHGWNNDKADARELYGRLFGSLEQVLGGAQAPGLAGRRFAALTVLWPSKKFTESELIPGGAASVGSQVDDERVVDQLEALKSVPVRLGEEVVDPVRAANLTRAQELVPALEDDEEARREFVLLVRTILSPDEAHPDDGSDELFTRDPEELMSQLAEPVPPPPSPAGGGAAADLGGGAAGLGDVFRGSKAAAQRLLNFTTYYQMKERAGLVGRTGVAQAVREVRRELPQLKVHLVGHSFGGRLVTAAADALGPKGVASLSLLQAAFSHNGLAPKFDGKHDGFFRKVMSDGKVAGPVLITHTKNDRAVGIAYPLASRLAQDNAAALGDANDPYGGMGRNGAQRTPEAAAGNLQEVGRPYTFAAGTVFNLQADDFIADHGDVAGAQVAYALLSAAAAS